MVTRKKEDETKPEKKPAVAKKVTADKPVKKGSCRHEGREDQQAPGDKGGESSRHHHHLFGVSSARPRIVPHLGAGP